MINSVGKNLPLQLNSAAAVLAAARDYPGLSNEGLALRAEIAKARADSVATWLGAAGWIRRGRLQSEGGLVHELDPRLASRAVQALFLARLAQNVSLWAELIGRYLYTCSTAGYLADPDEAVEYIGNNQERNRDQIRKDVGLVFSMLRESGALGALGMLTGAGNGKYRVSSHVPPAALVAYLTLTDYPEPAQAIPFGWLSMPGGPFRVFLLSGDLAGTVLADLERSGLVDSERAHNFNRFVLRDGSDQHSLLRRAVDESSPRT